jgi:hypothetical protein
VSVQGYIQYLISQLLFISKPRLNSLNKLLCLLFILSVFYFSYEILNQHCESCNDTDSNQVPELLRGKPWIWVGSAFVSSDQVAFDCPETARPYLFCVPEEIRCFDALLNDCGVKDQFCADDFVSLSMQMKKQVGNHAASQKQIDMMVFVTKYLSEFPEDELNSIEKDKMYLPSRDGKMYCAVDMVSNSTSHHP